MADGEDFHNFGLFLTQSYHTASEVLCTSQIDYIYDAFFSHFAVFTGHHSLSLEGKEQHEHPALVFLWSTKERKLERKLLA